MKSRVFESHNLEDKPLPVIFHHDEITVNTGYGEQWNWHNNIEILYIDRGEGEAVSGASVYKVRAGDIIIINSNVIHTTRTDDMMTYYCLIIDSDFLASNGITTEDTEYRTLIRDDDARKLFLRVVEEFENGGSFFEAAVKTAAMDVMLYFSRKYIADAEEKKAQRSSKTENIKLAMGYIRAHIDEPLSLEKLSFESGLSKFYFVREFKKATGMTPVFYINLLRCREAKKMLSKNKYSIHEVAQKCGFENDSYFSKTFKKYTGLLPSEYVRENCTEE